MLQREELRRLVRRIAAEELGLASEEDLRDDQPWTDATDVVCIIMELDRELGTPVPDDARDRFTCVTAAVACIMGDPPPAEPVPERKAVRPRDPGEVRAQVVAAIRANLRNVTQADITDTSTFESLGADIWDGPEIVERLEGECGVQIPDDATVNIGALIRFLTQPSAWTPTMASQLATTLRPPEDADPCIVA
jgi:acyl carrier protein